MSLAMGLRGQITRSLALMTLGIILLSVFGSYAFYAIAVTYLPGSISETWMPSQVELIWIVCTIIAAFSMAWFVAIRLSRRILTPLNSVAGSLRAIAEGKLDARAPMDHHAIGETAQLVRDFNAMAEQLQHMTREREFWNAAIAHELRTPVTILRGRLQGLVEGVFTPDESQFRSLLNQVDGLARLIEDLRAVSLAESGHLHLQLQQSDLDKEIESVVEFCRHAHQAAGQRLVLDLQAKSTRCDPLRIRQAVLAILDNARRHAVAGQVFVQTRLENGWCVVRVEDEGPGIPPEAAAQVFKAFRRMRDDGERGADVGSGLGLAVVAAIARAHRGVASCSPSTRGGACFELRWPNDKSSPEGAQGT